MRGQGNANATITATLTSDPDGTNVAINTDLQITGRVAQFGRGVLADVSGKLLDQFVADLEKTVLAPVEAVDVELQDPIEAVQPDAGEPELPPEDAVDPAPDAPIVEPAERVDDVAMAQPAPVAAPDKPAVRKIDSPDAKPVDLLDAAGSPVAKRVGPVLAVIALVWLLKKLLSRRKD
jgi:hypothetical protein